MRIATSLHFDALQAWSGQMLLPAAHWAAAAAMAGLASRRSERLCYPKDGNFTRIVLQRLLPSAFSIRLACVDDLDALERLEAFQPVGLRADAPTLLRRITQHPAGQFVAVDIASACPLGAMYTQRLSGEASLMGQTLEHELDLHVATGPVVQLLGLVVDPQVDPSLGSIGDAMRNFVLSQAQLDASVEGVCGVTRCRQFNPEGCLSYEAHARIGNDNGLQFHLGAGAKYIGVVHGYRAGDLANLQNGVLIRYELGRAGRCAPPPHDPDPDAVTRSARGSAPPHAAPALSAVQCEAIVCATIDELHYGGSAGSQGWTAERKQMPFMALGIDSLDAVTFVRRLDSRFGPSKM